MPTFHAAPCDSTMIKDCVTLQATSKLLQSWDWQEDGLVRAPQRRSEAVSRQEVPASGTVCLVQYKKAEPKWVSGAEDLSSTDFLGVSPRVACWTSSRSHS